MKIPQRLPQNELSAALRGRFVTVLLLVLLVGPASHCARRSRSKATNRNGQAAPGLSAGDLVAGRSGAGGASRLAPDPGRAQPLKVLSAALTTVDEKYVAPDRINPARMFDKALEFVEAERAELRITGGARSRQVLVQVGDRSRRFAVGPLSSVSMLYTQLKAILGYIRGAVAAQSNADAKALAELEYAAVNGAVSTLDPHSVLMPPKIYDEMQIRTRGAFGGVGIVISIRDGALTVISPIDDTPAARAGIRAGDKITKIGDESTVNMRLTDAVARLRGKPGTTVTFWVEREGWHDPRRFDIVRSRIEIKSVSSRVLPGRVGYVRINRFSHNTTDELKVHLRKLNRAQVKGVVLDLWNNPGGLLQQAEMVADTFLSSGDIVITEAARNVVLRVRKASAETTVFRKPVVVLVNRGSASAAEIVAGALKNQGRGLVIGETTFGKGTVQMLFDNPDHSALKLTVAQYLTPGNVSIQTVGVVPDVLTNAVEVRKRWIRMFGHELDARRRAKRKDLLPARSPKNRHPAFRLDYLSPDSDDERKKKNAQVSVAANAAEAPVIELGRQLLARYAGTRAEMLKASRTFLDQWGRRQEQHIARSLRGRGIDWRPAPRSATKVTADQLVVKAAPAQAGPVKAGGDATIRVTVTNRGAHPLFRLHGRTDAPAYYLHERELIFGRLGPGETRTVSLPVKVPPHGETSIQPVKVVLAAANLQTEVHAQTRLGIQALPRPRFLVAYRLHDDVKGNGDGRPEPGETIRLRLTVTNAGQGTMDKGVLSLRNLAGRGIFMLKGRHTLSKLAPGAKVSADLTFRIEPTFRKPFMKLEVSVYDSRLRASLQGHVLLPLSPKTASAPGLVGEITPPLIRLAQTPLVVKAGTRHVEISGTATDDSRVMDLYVEVTNYDADQVRLKAHYVASPRGKPSKQLGFRAKVPLWSGVNTILVVARENSEVMGFERLIVTKP